MTRLLLPLSLILLFSCNVMGQRDSVKVTFGEWKIVPCKLDTLKGTMYWQNHSDDQGDGNVWDTCYWVGKCGPEGILGNPYFVPGIIKHTVFSMPTGGKRYVKSISQHENCCFYDRHWRKIRGRDVYGMIPIFENKKAF